MNHTSDGSYTLRTYHSSNELKKRCHAPTIRASGLPLPGFECARWAGRMSRDSSHDTRNTVTTTSGTTFHTLPITPGTK